jgi:hypothetical protein
MVKKLTSLLLSLSIISVPAQALMWETFCGFFKKNRSSKQQAIKALQFYDYTEERDLKKIVQL